MKDPTACMTQTSDLMRIPCQSALRSACGVLLIAAATADTGLAQTLPAASSLLVCAEAISISIQARKLSPALVVPYAERALQLCRQQNGIDHPDTISTMISLANTYRESGRHADALKLREEALSLRRAKLGPDHGDTLAAMNAVAASYSDLGRHAESFKLFEQTWTLRRARLGPDHPDTLLSMNGLAQSLADLGRHEEALKLREETLRRRQAALGRDHPATLTTMSDQALTYGELGRHSESLKLGEETLALRRAKLGHNHPDVIASLHNLAITHSELGRHTEAISMREQVLALQRARLGPDHPSVLAAMHNLAISHSATGRHDDALKLRMQTFARMRETLGPNHPATLSSMDALAASYSDLGRHAEALKLRDETLALKRSALGPDHPATLGAMNNMAISLRELNRHADAAGLWEQTLARMRDKLGADHPHTLGSINSLAISYADLGRLADIPPLARTYKSGAERLRSQAGLSVSDRQSVFVAHSDAFRGLGRFLGRLGVREKRDAALVEGFELADLSKARTLIEGMAATTAARSAGLPASDLDTLQRIATDIAALDQSIARQLQSTSPDSDILRQQQARKRELENRITSLQERLKLTHPKYAQLLDVKAATAAEAKRLLASDQIVISFTLEEDGHLAAWLLDQRGLPGFVDLGRHAGLKGDIAKLRGIQSGADRSLPVGEIATLRQRAGDILLKPLLADANFGMRGKKRWIIIPDGDLALLPFDTLPITGAPGKPSSVVEAHEVSIVQSWSVYALLKEREAEYSKLARSRTLFAMGNAVYHAASHKTAAAVVREDRRVAARGWRGGSEMAETRTPSPAAEQRAIQNLDWINLPGTALEVEAVARVFPSGVDKYTDGNASEAALQAHNKAGRLADYRYLLFSAHGYLASNPALTSLVLSLDKPTPLADGYVTAAEWPAYNIKSDLTVLSACDTGVGKTLPGEGVMGLPYALFVAGNRNTLLTLWPVDDEATAEFMTRFFTRLKNGESQVGALTAVKREFAADGTLNDPRYWAAFALYGV